MTKGKKNNKTHTDKTILVKAETLIQIYSDQT